MPLETHAFGTLADGREARLIELHNGNGMSVGVTDLGASLVSVRVPDRRGGRPDVMLGFDGAYGYQAKEHALVSQISTMVGGRPEELPERVESLMTRLKDAEKRLAAAEQATLSARTAGIVSDAVPVGEVRLASANLGSVGAADAVRSLTLDARSRLGDSEPAVVAVGAVLNSRPVIVVATNAGARDKGIRAGALVRTAAQVLGGGGGGKDDLAQGGGQNPDALDEALRTVADQIRA